MLIGFSSSLQAGSSCKSSNGSSCVLTASCIEGMRPACCSQATCYYSSTVCGPRLYSAACCTPPQLTKPPRKYSVLLNALMLWQLTCAHASAENGQQTGRVAMWWTFIDCSRHDEHSVILCAAIEYCVRNKFLAAIQTRLTVGAESVVSGSGFLGST